MSSIKAILVVLCCVCVVSGHNWFTYPISRANQAQTQTGCRYGDAGKREIDLEGRQTCDGGPCCSGPCDATVRASGVPVYSGARGQVTYLAWNTHDHPGGFVRIAWSPSANSGLHSSFDSQVDRYVCKEIGGCDASESDSNYLLGQCNLSNYIIPTWLSDGAWTVQWAYFGGSNNAGDYYACADFTISGGSTLTSQPTTPVFVGGDAGTSQTTQCRFYTTDALHVCTEEPCNNGTNYNPSLGLTSFGPYYGPPKIFKNGALYNLDGSPASSGSGSGSGSGSATSTTSPRPITTAPMYTTGQLYTPGYTTQFSQPYIPQTGTTGAVGTKWCYKNGTPPNLNGPINNPPTCGTAAPNARCADGQCCSAQGVCGPTVSPDGFYYETINGVSQIVSQDYAISTYCAHAQADYRLVACTASHITLHLTLLISVILFLIF